MTPLTIDLDVAALQALPELTESVDHLADAQLRPGDGDGCGWLTVSVCWITI